MAAHLLEYSRHHGSLGRAQQSAQTTDADATAIELEFLHALDNGFAPGAAARANLPHPVLSDAPPLDFIAAADKRSDLAGYRKHHRDFRLMAADVSQITSVGLKLIPVALIGKSDNCVDLVSVHELADAGPAALALNMAEFWKAETTFAAIDHGRSR